MSCSPTQKTLVKAKEFQSFKQTMYLDYNSLELEIKEFKIFDHSPLHSPIRKSQLNLENILD